MSVLRQIIASLEHVRDARRAHHNVDKGSENAYTALGTILFWCRIACNKLLPDLEKKQNDEKDLAYVRREIESLYGTRGLRNKRQKSSANTLAFGKNEVCRRLVVFSSSFSSLTYLSQVSAEAVVFASSGSNFIAYTPKVNVNAVVSALICFYEIAFAL